LNRKNQKGSMMQNNILSKVAFSAQYSKQMKNGKMETWIDSVNRVLSMHLDKFKDNPEITKLIKESFELVKTKRVFASQRSIQFGGDAIKRNNMRIYNCTFSNCDRLRFFAESFWLLLSGCGTGFSIRRRHVDKIPQLVPPAHWINRESKVYIIDDNIESWCNAVFMLMRSYCRSNYFENWQDKELIFDYSKIRKKGEIISSGGRAPGSEPLRIALENIRLKLRECSKESLKLKPIDCFDITMYLSEAVLSGGVRRSASIALFDKDDQEMIKSKHGNWFINNVQRSRANISAAFKLGDNETQSEVNEIINYAREYGEPGIAFFNSHEFGTNPCAEIGLMPTAIRDPYGEPVENISIDLLENETKYINKGYSFYSGWQVCNLTEINMKLNPSKKEFFESCRAAAIIGTIQASYTNVGYLNEATKFIIENEALIGVSMTGMSENKLSFDPETLRAGADIVNKTNKMIADLIGIKSASRTTCIKPSGNTSTIGGTSAGIHPHHSKKYIRTIRINKMNALWDEIQSKVSEACETDLTSKETGIVSFACKAPADALTKDDDSAIDHLKRVKLVFDHWVKPGSEDSRVKKLTHNVSNTCIVKNDEWNDVSKYIFKNRDSLRGVALMSYFNENYPQLPFQKVIDEDSLKKWNMLNSLDWSKVDFQVFGYRSDPTLEPACSGGQCSI
tara:strand:+ start:330 stop:2366 length:2037 start_codon:yes stop_codon:yes gene_type:complete